MTCDVCRWRSDLISGSLQNNMVKSKRQGGEEEGASDLCVDGPGVQRAILPVSGGEVEEVGRGCTEGWKTGACLLRLQADCNMEDP